MKNFDLKLSVTVVLFTLSMITNAQDVHFGLTQGFSFRSIELGKPELEYEDECGHICEGLFVGVNAEFKLPTKHLYANTSLLYGFHEFCYDGKTQQEYCHTENVQFVSIPMNLEFRLSLPAVLSFFVETGPELKIPVNNRYLKDSDYRLDPVILGWTIAGGFRLGDHWKFSIKGEEWITKGVKEKAPSGKYVNCKKSTKSAHASVSFYF